MPKNIYKILWLGLGFLFLIDKPVSAVTVYSRQTGNWSDNTPPGTWSLVALGGADCSCVPASTDDVIIGGGNVVTFDGSMGNTTINSLQIDAGGSTLTYADNSFLASNTNIILNGTINGNNTGDVRIAATTAGSTLSGTGFFTRTVAGGNFQVQNNITILAGTDITFNSLGILDMNNKVVTNNGKISILDPSNLSNIGTFVNNAATSTLVYTKQADWPGPTLTATATGNTVEFGSTAGGPFLMDADGSYYHLIITGGATKQLDVTPTTIAGNLTINVGAILDCNAKDINIAGNWTNNNAAGFTEGNRTVTFNGSLNSQTVTNTTGTETFNNLTISNTFGGGGTITAGGNISITSARLLNITSGIFIIPGPLQLNQTGAANLTMSGGELRLGETGATLPRLSGTYTLTAGIIDFMGAGAQTIRGGKTYFNVNINTSGGSGTKTIGIGTLDINGNLTITSGTLDVDPTPYAITLAGNWSNSGTFTSQTGTVTFDGTAQQTVSGTTATSFYNLIINNSLASSAISLSQNFTITNNLTLTDGHILSSATYMPTFGTAATVTAAKDSSCVKGPVTKLTNSTTTFTFPTGKSIYYQGIGITPASGAATTWVVQYYDSEQGYGTAISGLDHISAIEYWTLDRTAGTANANVILSWNSNSVVTLLATLLVSQFDATNTWVSQGNTASTGAPPTGPGTITSVVVTSFSNIAFTLACTNNTDNPLTYNRYSVATGNFNSTATWSSTPGGAPGFSIPGATTKVYIVGGWTVNMTAGGTCKKLEIGSTANGAGNLNFNTAAITLAVLTSGITIYTNGDVIGSAATTVLSSTGNIVFPVANKTLTNTVFSLRTLTTNGITISGIGTIANLDIDINTTNTDSLTVTTILTGTGATFTNGAAAELNIGGAMTQANYMSGSTVLGASTAGNKVYFSTSTANFNYADDATTFYHLIITNGTKIQTVNTTVNGNLTILATGNINWDNNNMDCDIAGNFINQGAFSAGTANASEITFNGGGAQQITSGGSVFGNVTIANTSGNVSILDNMVIMTGQILTMTSGYLILGGFNLTLNSTSADIVTPTSAKFIVTNGAGYLAIQGCGNRTFPVGISAAAASYTPVIVNNTGTADEFRVRVICNEVYTDGTCGGALEPAGHILKTWEVNEVVSGGSTATVTLQWNAADEDGTFNRALCHLARYGAYSSGWAPGWNELQADGAAGGGGPYTRSASTTKFSPFGVGSGTAPLPVGLLNFTAEYKNNTVQLMWATSSEKNFDHFTVEKSRDAQSFEPLTKIQGSGSSSIENNYSIFDESPFDEVTYYRLKQTDLDGKFSYSAIVSVQIPVNSIKVKKIFPNPNGHNAFIDIYSPETTTFSLELLSITGEIVKKVDTQLNKGENLVEINLEELGAGIYFFKLPDSIQTSYGLNKIVVGR